MTIVQYNNQITTDAKIIGVFLVQGEALARVIDIQKHVIRGIEDKEEIEIICNLYKEVVQIKTILQKQTTKPIYIQAIISQAKYNIVLISP